MKCGKAVCARLNMSFGYTECWSAVPVHSVLTADNVSKGFPIQNGLRGGHALSPVI